MAPVRKSRGYQKLAVTIGLHSEMAVLRRFGFLNMLNLMSFQADLID